MPILVVDRGNDKGRSVQLEPGKSYVFGRDPQASTLVLNDTLSSRRHFQINMEEKTVTIRDLSSTNGTYLNDERIEVAQLKVGDKIQVGDTILSFLSDKREETQQGLVGKVLGGYEVQERVGRGGMGTVYKAIQLSLNRTVALKVLSARLLKDSKFIDRFKSEARAAGQMNHPNIVQVYDVGTDRNLHFFSMEFMDGGSLQDKVGKDGKLTWNQTLDNLIQAASALVFAEKSGIVHRDVKPDNLMLTSDGQAKLADLGLAHRRDGSEVEVEEGIFGTPHFISPEQAQGKEIDHRADLYSLGATAYRLLSGHTPFQGSQINEIIRQQIHDDPPPLRKEAPDAPEELIAVIEKLMEKDPDDRYPSAADLQKDLEAIRLKYHLKAQGVGGGKGVLIAVGLALVAVIAVLAYYLSQNGGEPAVPRENLPQGTGTQVPDRPDIDNPPPDTPTTDPEALAENALLKVQIDEKGLGEIAATWKSRGAEWTRIAERYDEVAAQYPDTESGKAAATRSMAVTSALETHRKAEQDRLRAAEQAWKTHRAGIEDALTKDRYAEALQLAEKARDDAEIKGAADLLPEARKLLDTWLDKTANPDSVRGRFKAAWDRAKADAKDLRARGEYAEASAACREFLSAAAGAETRPPFGPAGAELTELLQAMRSEYSKKLEAAVKADRAAFFAGYLAVRHYEDPELTFPDNPVFQYRFTEAADRMSTLLQGAKALTTEPYRERARAKVAQLRSMASLMQALIEALRSGAGGDELDLPEHLRGGSNVKRTVIDRSTEPPANAEGIAVTQHIRVGGRDAVAKRFLPWDKFSALELWTSMFLSGKRWEMSPEQHAAAARFLAECGIADGLPEEIGQAGSALEPAERSSLDRELKAIRAWAAVDALRESRPGQEWLVASERFVARCADSDYFILVYGFTSPGDRYLFPENVIKDWIDAKLKPLDGK